MGSINFRQQRLLDVHDLENRAAVVVRREDMSTYLIEKMSRRVNREYAQRFDH